MNTTRLPGNRLGNGKPRRYRTPSEPTDDERTAIATEALAALADVSEEHVIRIMSHLSGAPTGYEDTFVAEYDPTRAGRDLLGHDAPIHLVTTPDAALAMTFPTFIEAAEAWRQPSGRTRSDGEPDRPLTVFTVSIEPLAGANGR